MDVRMVDDPKKWDAFLIEQTWSPFLQSATMADVYKDIGQRTLKLGIFDGSALKGICLAHLVPARRGAHVSVPYGPVLADNVSDTDRHRALTALHTCLTDEARKQHAWFIRISPFLPSDREQSFKTTIHARRSPMHLLAEHLWILRLEDMTEEHLMMHMRKTTRNLVRRAGRDGVTIKKADDPMNGVEHFIRLHEETRQRHQFTPYTNTFFRSQVRRFAEKNNVTVYLAEFENKIIASSIHMHFGGETSYHHGASASAYSRIPASHLLQWTAIRDALTRGDHVYNFWGIAPEHHKPGHPFAGITTFKTGFGGERLTLMPCIDVPVHPAYHATRALEMIRKFRRGF